MTPKIFRVPLISQERLSYERKIWYAYSQGESKQMPLIIFPEKGAWPCHVTPKIFRVPPNISGTGKATNAKFGTHIHSDT